jgi:hypothetical protein
VIGTSSLTVSALSICTLPVALETLSTFLSDLVALSLAVLGALNGVFTLVFGIVQMLDKITKTKENKKTTQPQQNCKRVYSPFLFCLR